MASVKSNRKSKIKILVKSNFLLNYMLLYYATALAVDENVCTNMYAKKV